MIAVYQIGDYVVKANSGICRIQDICHLDMPNVDRSRLYYAMVTQDSMGSRLYVPVDGRKNEMRKVISEPEAWDIIEKIPDVEAAWINDEKQREQKYREALKSCDPELLIGIIKNMYLRKQKRTAQGKRSTVVDDRYFRLAEDALYSEQVAKRIANIRLTMYQQRDAPGFFCDTVWVSIP